MKIGKYTLVETSSFNNILAENSALEAKEKLYRAYINDLEIKETPLQRYEKMMRLITKFYIMVICLVVAALLIRYYMKNS